MLGDGLQRVARLVELVLARGFGEQVELQCAAGVIMRGSRRERRAQGGVAGLVNPEARGPSNNPSAQNFLTLAREVHSVDPIAFGNTMPSKETLSKGPAKKSIKKTSKPTQAKSRKKAASIASKQVATTGKSTFYRVAKADAIDLRDRPFHPNISLAPQASLYPANGMPVKHQGNTNACTGFALSLVVEHLLYKAKRERKADISPYMLYSMARRYDEFPGSTEDDGSSLRGALKGWFKHGACHNNLFPDLVAPGAKKSAKDDWWLDAVKRPLGAYYRVDTTSVTDMHAALNEVGILFASAGCHTGWDEGNSVKPLARRPASIDKVWEIPVRGGRAQHPGHAFAIVGYNEVGFLIQNSWGEEWGSHGYAILTYDDWLANAMDCWVAQLGVVTKEHELIAQSPTLRRDSAGRVLLAASKVLRDREISPFIINMGNNGALSNSGTFRTKPDDVRAIVDIQLAKARQAWDLKADQAIDVCIYAHGGLVGEEDAAETAAEWIPMLYEKKIFPVFLMWETDFITTVMNTIEDAIKGIPRTTGFSAAFERLWNQRLERFLARPGTQIWGEMKQNADAMSFFKEDIVDDDEQAGVILLYRHFKHYAVNNKVRMHIVGHSAGSIVAAFMIDRMIKDGMSLESLSLMAPAVRVDTFDKLVRPHLDGSIKRYQQFHLSDRAEEDDPTCGPYRRSLLYLVSESFEGGTTTPILGMQKYFDAYAKEIPSAKVHVSPGQDVSTLPDEPPVASSTHGGFDNDPGTKAKIVRFIKGITN